MPKLASEDAQGYESSDSMEDDARSEVGVSGPELGFSYKQLVTLHRMVEKGWRLFCAKHRLDPDEPEWSFRDAAHAEASECMGKRRHA